MCEYGFSMQDLSHMAIENEQDQEYVLYWTVENFQKAIAELNNAGVTQRQVQFLIGRVFSKFGDLQYRQVLLLALALKKGKVSATKIHKKIQEMEYWARIYGKTICFETESLQNMDTIKAYLGLGCAAD